MIRALGFWSRVRSGFNRPRVHFDGEPDLAKWRDLAGGYPPVPKPLPAPPRPPTPMPYQTPGTLTEQFDESAVGVAVAVGQVASLVERYGLETVVRWLAPAAARAGKRLTLEQSGPSR